jgi:hypothetical protein
MDPISNVDGLVLLLRQRLAERARMKAAGVNAQRPVNNPRIADGIDAVHALAGIDNIDERLLKRSLIQSLLTDHFGAAMINDAQFQQVVDRVTDAIDGDDQSSRLLSAGIRALRTSSR